MYSFPCSFSCRIAIKALDSALNQADQTASFIHSLLPTGSCNTGAMDDAGNKMVVVDPEAARKKVSHASSSGGIFMPRDAPAENFNILAHLNYLSLNHQIAIAPC